MVTWPSITAPDQGTEEEYYKPQIKIEFEANYVQTRAQATRARHAWPSLGWSTLPESEFQLLESFFLANQGNSFTWTHPVTSVAYVCVFSSNYIKNKFGVPGYRTDVTCAIEEL